MVFYVEIRFVNFVKFYDVWYLLTEVVISQHDCQRTGRQIERESWVESWNEKIATVIRPDSVAYVNQTQLAKST